MKKRYKIFAVIAVAALCAFGFAGCEEDLDGAIQPPGDNGNTITITGIPSRIKNMEVRIMSDIDPYPGVKIASGYNDMINNGKMKIFLLNEDMEDWTGSGNHFIVLDLDKVYVYTNGEPILPPRGNVLRYNFQNGNAEIGLDKFRSNDQDPYKITITGITGNFDASAVTVYNAASEIIAEGEAEIIGGTTAIDLYVVNDFFEGSGWKGEQAVLTLRLPGMTYVYTGGGSLSSNIGVDTWGQAPKYSFPDMSSSVSFSQLKTNDPITQRVAITIEDLESIYNSNHFVSIILSTKTGYNPKGSPAGNLAGSIQESGEITSGAAGINVTVPIDVGQLYILVIVVE
jgi:hypothetical protein